MQVSDLSSDKGLKEFNSFISDKSYINGYTPSKADLAALDSIKKPLGTDAPHAKRWLNHIKSFSSQEQAKWAGSKELPSNFSKSSKAADDDDVDLFGSDEEEDAEAAKVREERLKAYAAKKSNKPVLIAKSSIVLDVKPWDDETDMKEMEKRVRSIVRDGLVWGASKLVPVGYGIHKLQIMCVVEDDKVSVDELTETIQEFEDFVQSVDIAAFNKV